MRFATAPALAAVLAAVVGLCAGARPARAQAAAEAAPAAVSIKIEARLIDPASGLEAGWGATGQVLIPPQQADPALRRWQARAVATSPARQSLTLAPGTRGLIRVGREIPFAGWFLRHGTACGWLERGTEWREVESALEVELAVSGADGAVRLSLTPEFSYLTGRARYAVAFVGERIDVTLAPGAETRLDPVPERAAFYGRLLAGYDPLRRVWPVALLLRADAAETAEP